MVSMFSNKQPRRREQKDVVVVTINDRERTHYILACTPYNGLDGSQSFYDKDQKIGVSISEQKHCLNEGEETRVVVSISSMNDEVYDKLSSGEWFIHIGSSAKLTFKALNYTHRKSNSTIVARALHGFEAGDKPYDEPTRYFATISSRLVNKSKGVYHTNLFSTQIEYDRLVIRSDDLVVSSFKIPDYVPDTKLGHLVYCIKIDDVNAMWVCHVITSDTDSRVSVYYVPTMNDGTAPSLVAKFTFGKIDDLIGGKIASLDFNPKGMNADTQFYLLSNNNIITISHVMGMWDVREGERPFMKPVNAFSIESSHQSNAINVVYNVHTDEPLYDSKIMQISNLFGEYYETYLLDNGKIAYLPNDVLECVTALNADLANTEVEQVTTRNSVSFSLGDN